MISSLSAVLEEAAAVLPLAVERRILRAVLELQMKGKAAEEVARLFQHNDLTR